MSELAVTIAPAQAVSVPTGLPTSFVDVVYTRKITGNPGHDLSDLPSEVSDTVRVALDSKLTAAFTLADVKPGSPLELRFLAGNGSARLIKQLETGEQPSVHLALSAEDVKLLAATVPQPPPPAPTVDRRAYFVLVGDAAVAFDRSRLSVSPIALANDAWKRLRLDQLFHADVPASTSIAWSGTGWSPTVVAWTEVPLAADGKFRATFPQKAGEAALDAWLWWLSGPQPAIGILLDDLSVVRVAPIGIPLPPMAAVPAEAPGRTPSPTSEAEVAGNPGIYTEDPGEFCKPFKNPERVLGERSFFVTLRVEQPLIGAGATVGTLPVPTLTFDATAAIDAAPVAATTIIGRVVNAVRGRVGEIVSDAPGLSFVRDAIPKPYVEMLRRLDRGRTALDASHPIQWEGDISRYQATTVARGHILEYRMRWRSNGYSLGTVAKTLTLAPRQTRRIQKIEWQRAEAARRSETTRLFDQVSDSVSRDRDYDDSVRANLSEWARGSSSSSMSAAAGGFGFAGAGFVIGGGGGGSHAQSSSSQSGGRSTAAAEEQRLRDSIRRYGDALRRLESMVVSEVTQEETVTGTTEVVRNQNYAHALTVIYYQILRHLKIETSVAGVRECLFVPFAITPFTIARAYRWRELIAAGLRDPAQATAIKYLKDVLTGFASSDIPVGRRSDQPVRYVFGSVYLRVAIERPRDKDDGGFDDVAWAVIRGFLGSPALGIFTRLKALGETARDAAFQRDHAPTIASSWIDTLELWAGTTRLDADFTLATRYAFNGVVRVDFTAPISQSITRETLSSLRLTATHNLPPGSVAHLTSLSFTYETDQYQRTVKVNQGEHDLVSMETGVHDAGATLFAPPDTWERRNIRQEMIAAVQGLVEHLNEHVEYYHKVIWWRMDRDRLFMLIDGFYIPGTNDISIGSVVERDPIAIVGNCLVFRVAAGAFLGIGDITTPAQLLNHYIASQALQEPMLLALPTDGLYAQTVMDECDALEEHFGNTDWALSEPDPELGAIAPELLASRQSAPPATTPTPLPQTLINLLNAPDAPAPAGIAAALAAVQNANAFRDMAGLAGTQANAAAGFQAAATLASSFGAQAAALKLADMAAKAHATQTADQKLATVQRAVDKQLVDGDTAQQHASKILDELHAPTPSIPHQDPTLAEAVRRAMGVPGSAIEASTPEGQLKVSLAQLTQPLQQACGFFGQNGLVREADLRQAIADQARAELANWRNFTGTALFRENENTTPNDARRQFGHLVRYWLARQAAILPSTLTAAQANAISLGTNYGQLLDLGAVSTAALNAAKQAARADVLAGAPSAAPANLDTLVETSLEMARFSRRDELPHGPWSAVFVVDCVRLVAIQLGLEAENAGGHVGQDELLLAAQRHADYVVEAHRRRFGPNARTGTYHAFRIGERKVGIGDIIVQDRQATAPEDVMLFSDITGAAMSTLKTHGDIVIEVADDHVVTIGGNLGNSARRRRYPITATGLLVIDVHELYTEEDDNLQLPPLPAHHAGNDLHDQSTWRIFALLSLVEQCGAIPGQKVNGGVLV